MRKQTIYQLNSLYRDNMKVTGYYYGKGEPALCIMGALRGDEIQQLYICSQLNKRLKQIERDGGICPGKEVLIIPTANLYSINVGKRFWPSDNTDINRMFPGYALGETTQRIAAGLFEAIRHYQYGIHFCSSYTKGKFLTHVRLMHTGFEDVTRAKNFGLPYVVIREPKPYDTTTLNYNWQIWETAAFSVYTGGTDRIDYVSAEEAVEAALSFMAAEGIIHYESADREESCVMWEKEEHIIKCGPAGLLRPLVHIGDSVEEGELLAEILDPYIGEVCEEIFSPGKGRVFFQRDSSLVYSGAVVFRLVQ